MAGVGLRYRHFMAMTDLEGAVRRLRAEPDVVGDAVRWALVTELLQAVAATIRFVVLNPQTWVAGRFTEDERDTLRTVVDRIENATARDLLLSCPLCGAHTCDPGCALESVRALAQARPGLADATPTTEADRT